MQKQRQLGHYTKLCFQMLAAYLGFRSTSAIFVEKNKVKMKITLDV